MAIKHLLYIICLSLIGLTVAPPSKADTAKKWRRLVSPSSALIIVLQHHPNHSLSYQRYGGFSPRYKIGPYIRPTYSQDRLRVNTQRYSGFRRIYKLRCRRCQTYTGFKKTYSGRRYSGFRQKYLRSDYRYPSRYLSGAFATNFRTY